MKKVVIIVGFWKICGFYITVIFNGGDHEWKSVMVLYGNVIMHSSSPSLVHNISHNMPLHIMYYVLCITYYILRQASNLSIT